MDDFSRTDAAKVLAAMPGLHVDEQKLCCGVPWVRAYNEDDSEIELDGDFTPEQLAAIAWWASEPALIGGFAKSIREEPPS